MGFTHIRQKDGGDVRMRIALLLSSYALLICLLFASQCESKDTGNYTFVFEVNIPPRLQWLHNDGYCGEVSTISTGLNYGQYFSQYDMREIASNYAKFDSQTKKYYLIGVNDQRTAEAVRLNHIEYNSTDYTPGHTQRYLAWIKAMTRLGYPVTMTVFMNYWLFYGNSNPTAGDPLYDHIVSVVRVESDYDDNEYHDDDLLTFSDHGVWSPKPKHPQYFFSYTFQESQATRKEANAHHGNVYSVPAESNIGNFGIAHTGIIDLDGVTLPVRVDTNLNYESPEIAAKSNTRPKPMELVLGVIVSGLQEGEQYRLYRYSDERVVPVSSFNAESSNATVVYDIVGDYTGTFIMSEKILSDEKVIYRAVPADAP